MNQVGNALAKILVLAIFLMAALYITLDIMLADGRSLARFYLYAAIAAFLCGAVASRMAFFFCLITTGYIDFFKRLLAVFGRPTPTDLYYILGIPPLLIAGAVVNVLIQFILGRREFRTIHVWTLGGSSMLLGLSLLQGLGGDSFRSMGDAVNQGAYAFLFFLIPELLPSVEDRQRIYKWMVPIFLGVALYMLRHHFFGLADFEHEYLKSGISIESRILWENDGALRGFSTMAGASVVSVLCSIMMLVVLVPLGKEVRRPGLIEWMFRGGLCLLFAYASWTTVSRGGWVCGATAFVAYFFLKTRARAAIGYTIGSIAFVSLLFAAPLLVKKNTLGKLEVALQSIIPEDNAYAKRAVVMGTMNARLEGWTNLTTNPKVWTPIGMRRSGVLFQEGDESIYGHDFLIEFLVKFGYIPLFAVAAAGIVLLIQLNREHFRKPPENPERRLERLALAVTAGIFIGGLGNGAQLWVYPQNFYFYLSLAVVFTSYVNSKKAKYIAVPSADRLESEILAEQSVLASEQSTAKPARRKFRFGDHRGQSV